ncbi:MAG: glycoside hydrolase family 140 protein [Gemmatimonadaceae bacterium]|nr:glycoside hydrolase family 140 protein [Chitinophagaceae bacterium]
MKTVACLFTFFTICISSTAQFAVSPNGRFLMKDGKPFSWIGDTAWELFHKLGETDTDKYLKKRSDQGFTVVQAVILAELDGLHTPNAKGEMPLIDDDPTKPNEKYFAHVDWVIDKAAFYNITIALLPTWGDKVFKDKWGKGPEIFNQDNATLYAEWLARRYKDKKNIIWVLGGDRLPRNASDINIWRAMGAAIKDATENKAIISFHPQPAELGSATWFHQDSWLSFNMFQTGHCRDTEVYEKIQKAYILTPIKPVMDAEPIYEDHPVCFNARELGTSNALDVRRAAYLNLIAGAFGHTYGCHGVWQMYSPAAAGINGPHLFWYDALDLPGAGQMKFVRKIIDVFPADKRAPDQSVLKDQNTAASERVQAAIGKDFILVYTTAGKSFEVSTARIKGGGLKSAWYNPRNGNISNAEPITVIDEMKFTPPSSGYGQDWILIICKETSRYLAEISR